MHTIPDVTQGFLADADLSANDIELARQRAATGAGYIDLTGSNPTTQGLLFPPEILRQAAEPFWAQRRYAPDPRGQMAARQAMPARLATNRGCNCRGMGQCLHEVRRHPKLCLDAIQEFAGLAGCVGGIESGDAWHCVCLLCSFFRESRDSS